MVSGTSEMCSLRGWILVFTVQGRRQTACKACGWAVCWCQRCGSSGPWWRWGYGMGRRILWTQVHFIDGILRYCDEILRPIAVPFIHDHHLILQMIMHGSMLKDLYTIPGSWKHPSSCRASILTAHVPLSMFGMLWISVYNSVFQFLPISNNFTKPLKRPQSTTWSTLCKGDVLRCTAWGKWWSHQILTGFQTPQDICCTF